MKKPAKPQAIAKVKDKVEIPKVTIEIPKGFQTEREMRLGITERQVSAKQLARHKGDVAAYWKENYADRTRKQYTSGKMTKADYDIARENFNNSFVKKAEAYDADGKFLGWINDRRGILLDPEYVKLDKWNIGLTRADAEALGKIVEFARKAGVSQTNIDKLVALIAEASYSPSDEQEIEDEIDKALEEIDIELNNNPNDKQAEALRDSIENYRGSKARTIFPNW